MLGSFSVVHWEVSGLAFVMPDQHSGNTAGEQLCLAVTSDLSNTVSHLTETMSHCCFTPNLAF